MTSPLMAQAGLEFRLTMRRGESLVVTLVIPLLLLGFFSKVDVLGNGEATIDFLTPGVIALSIIATSMVSFAISTGYDRSYGVLKLIGGSPLGRGRLILAKILAIGIIQLGQIVCVVALALALGWAPDWAGLPQAFVVAVVGSATFTGLGLLLAGTLRAEATLAVANLLFILFIPFGGVVYPVDRMPALVGDVAKLLPVTAFVEALRRAFAGTPALVSAPFALLCVWGVVLVVSAVRTFKWE